ncbi:unnamed protein product [Brachionus calyciflorus]|uniref:MULE transposase domain-containing protein n=1 Tax=Brachionus calyciflorus TaxID=104777 RepID=A0A813W2K5_9BILA|nr:unnamed protein product [Brachionus calyciflorus]
MPKKTIKTIRNKKKTTSLENSINDAEPISYSTVVPSGSNMPNKITTKACQNDHIVSTSYSPSSKSLNNLPLSSNDPSASASNSPTCLSSSSNDPSASASNSPTCLSSSSNDPSASTSNSPSCSKSPTSKLSSLNSSSGSPSISISIESKTINSSKTFSKECSSGLSGKCSSKCSCCQKKDFTTTKSSEKTRTGSVNSSIFILIKQLDHQDDVENFIQNKFFYTHISHSQFTNCTSKFCIRDSPHKMRLIYSVCNCKKDSCRLKLKIIKCEIDNEYYIYKKSTHKGKLHKIRKICGIHCAFKRFIISMLKTDISIPAKKIHSRILLQPELGHLTRPKLKQVQNIVNNYRMNSGGSNSISAVKDFIKQNLYKEGIEENKPFFFSVDDELKLGDGSNEEHLNICISSLKLLSNLDSSIPGAYHIDGTYKLIKNRFPLIVFGKTDMNQKLHVLAFCITSHEQEEEGIVESVIA